MAKETIANQFLINSTLLLKCSPDCAGWPYLIWDANVLEVVDGVYWTIIVSVLSNKFQNLLNYFDDTTNGSIMLCSCAIFDLLKVRHGGKQLRKQTESYKAQFTKTNM